VLHDFANVCPVLFQIGSLMIWISEPDFLGKHQSACQFMLHPFKGVAAVRMGNGVIQNKWR